METGADLVSADGHFEHVEGIVWVRVAAASIDALRHAGNSMGAPGSFCADGRPCADQTHYVHGISLIRQSSCIVILRCRFSQSALRLVRDYIRRMETSLAVKAPNSERGIYLAQRH